MEYYTEYDIWEQHIIPPFRGAWNLFVEELNEFGSQFMKEKGRFADYLDSNIDEAEGYVPYDILIWVCPMCVAGSKLAFIFAHGYVDIIRLGEGFQEGGWGYLEDGLRLFSIVSGPLGRVVKIVRTTKYINAARFITDHGGPICHIRSGAKALVQTGVKSFISIKDYIKMAYPYDWFHKIELFSKGSSFTQLLNLLNQLNIRYIFKGNIKSWDELVKLVPKDGSVLVVNAARKRIISPLSSSSGSKLYSETIIDHHAFNVFYDVSGKLKIMDEDMIFSNLDELCKWHSKKLTHQYISKYFSDISIKDLSFSIKEAIHIPKLFVKKVLDNAFSLLHMLSIPILGYMNVSDKKTNKSADMIIIDGGDF